MRPIVLLICLVLTHASLTSMAQKSCSDLAIQSVQYSPFTDTLILVEVTNTGLDIFSYPGFVLISSEGDTLAQEVVNFFGIGETSVHMLTVRPGVADPLQHFTGTLELYMDFFGTFACSWPIDQGLCASTPCEELTLGLDNWGGALVLGDFEWSLSDSTGNTVHSGTFTMTDNPQYWRHTVCAAPGNYSYHLQALGEPSGGGPVMSVSSGEEFGAAAITQYFEWQGLNVMEVPFFLHCMDNATDVTATRQRNTLSVRHSGQMTTIQHGHYMHNIQLIGLDGRIIEQWSPYSSEFSFTSPVAKGMYVLVVNTATERLGLKVIVP